MEHGEEGVTGAQEGGEGGVSVLPPAFPPVCLPLLPLLLYYSSSLSS